MRAFIEVLKGLIEVARLQVDEIAATEAQLSAYEWLMKEMSDPRSTRVQVLRDNKFQPGKIHIFHYNPKYKDVLDYYDTHPVMLHIGTVIRGESRLELGQNITWWPKAARRLLVQRVRDLYSGQYDSAITGSPNRAKDQRTVNLDIYRLRYLLDPLGFSFATRFYLNNRVLSERVVVDYEDWEKMTELDVPRVFPELKGSVGPSEVYQRFFQCVRKANADRNGLLARIERQRESNYYQFVGPGPR